MAISEFEIRRNEKIMDAYIERHRPPVNIRDQLDLGYRLKGQNIELFEIRPRWDAPEQKIEEMIAKTTFVKSSGLWKVFWQRADLKWHRYEPEPVVESLEAFLVLITEDKYHCFHG